MKLTSSNLVANGCKHKAESCEELCCSRVKLRDNSWHVPLKISPDIAVGGSDEYRGKGAKGANDGQGEELMAASESVFGKPSKVLKGVSIREPSTLTQKSVGDKTYGHIDRHRAKKAYYHVQARKSAICSVHESACHLSLPSYQRPSTLCDNHSPEKQCQESWGHDDCLDQKQNAKFGDRHCGKYGLDHPVQEEAQQLCSYTSVSMTELSGYLRAYR